MFETEADIIEGLKSEGVIEINRILKRGPPKRHEVENLPEKNITNTGKFILTFEANELPSNYMKQCEC